MSEVVEAVSPADDEDEGTMVGSSAITREKRCWGWVSGGRATGAGKNFGWRGMGGVRRIGRSCGAGVARGVGVVFERIESEEGIRGSDLFR